MNKQLKGYMTVEASFIMPIVMVLYLLIIISGFFLYDRCVMSQDQYLLAFRGSRFTNGAENVGEVIYSDRKEEVFDRQYVEERVVYKQGFYPMFGKGIVKIETRGDVVSVYSRGFLDLLKMKKEARWVNPFVIVKKRRREGYA